MNETDFRIPENTQSKSATLWAQESIGKVLSRQISSMHENTNKLALSLFSKVKHKWKTSWIDDAIKQLGELDEEIAEEGYPSINDKTKRTAKKILADLNSLKIESSPFGYPTVEGEIAIDFKSRNYSMLILVINEKSVETYSSFFNSDTEYQNYSASFENIYDFTTSQLRALRGTSLSQSVNDR